MQCSGSTGARLPYWVRTLAGLSLLGSLVLTWYHPGNSPLCGIGGIILCQTLSIHSNRHCER